MHSTALPHWLHFGHGAVHPECFQTRIAMTKSAMAYFGAHDSGVLLTVCLQVLPRRPLDASQVGHMEWSLAKLEEDNKAQIGKG